MRYARRTLPNASSYFDALLIKGACSVLTTVKLAVVRRSFLAADCDTRFGSFGNNAVCKSERNLEYFWCIPNWNASWDYYISEWCVQTFKSQFKFKCHYFFCLVLIMGTIICTYNYSVMSMFIFTKVIHDCPSADYRSRLVSLRTSGSIVPRILHLCFRLEGVVNVILQSPYSLRRIPCVQWIGGHVGFRASTNIVMKSETTFPAGNRFPNIHSAIALPSRNPYWATFTL